MSSYDRSMEQLNQLHDLLSDRSEGVGGLLSDLRELRHDMLKTRTTFLVCWFGFFIPALLAATALAVWYFERVSRR